MTFVDANIILRFLTNDHPKKAAACRDLFERVASGEKQVTSCEAIISEVVYVLRSGKHYGLTAEETRTRLVPILSLRSFTLPYKRSILEALDLTAENPSLDFEDALAAAHMRRQGIETILSYDTDFDTMPGITRAEPGAVRR